MSDEELPDNFPAWWVAYVKGREGQQWEIGGEIWLACYSAWNYSREILKRTKHDP